LSASFGSAARRENAEEDKQTDQARYDNQAAVKKEFPDEAERLAVLCEPSSCVAAGSNKGFMRSMRLQV